MKRVTRLAGAVAAIALAAGMTLAGTGVARADVIPPSGWSEIYSPNLHGQGLTLCLDDPNSSTASGTPVQLYHCHGYASNGAPQRWRFIQAADSKGDPISYEGEPVYLIYNEAANLCLGGTGLTAGDRVDLGTCSLTSAKSLILWRLLSTSSSVFELWALDPAWPHTMCALASNASGSNGTSLVMEPCGSSITTGVFSLG
jgi:hypothetical protein